MVCMCVSVHMCVCMLVRVRATRMHLLCIYQTCSSKEADATCVNVDKFELVCEFRHVHACMHACVHVSKCDHAILGALI